MSAQRHTLRHVQILSPLSDQALAVFEQQCRWQAYRARKQIVAHNDESRDVFFVVYGRVRVTIFSLKGKEVSYREVEAGEMFGEFAAIDGEPRSASIIAAEECLVAAMPPDSFWQLLCDHPDVMAALLKSHVSLLRLYSERIFEFTALAVSNRIQAELLRLAREHMIDDRRAAIYPVPTHPAIASRVSTHREAVTRELSSLTRDGLLERRDDKLYVNDVNKLERLVQEVIGS